MKRILISGTGQFATNWVINNDNYKNINLTTSNRINFPAKNYKVDYFNYIDLRSLIKDLQPDAIINSAALTNIDYCENNKEFAHKINTIIPRNLSRISGELDIPFVQLSTDNFFSQPTEKRDESVIPIPVNTYGETKINAESEIRNNTQNYIIARTNFFGYSPPYAKSSLMKLIGSFENKNDYIGITDWYFNPISVDLVIECIGELLIKKYTGIINISGDDCISKHDFAKLFIERLGYSDKTLMKSRLSKMEKFVERPKIMCIDNDKVKSLLTLNSIGISDQIELYEANLKNKKNLIDSIR
jgi:dTDP-4-dehydrorhamnose reductase